LTAYTLHTMTRAEIDLAIAWAAQEGWNPGLQDAECFACTDPQGFWIGKLAGEAIATLSAVRYGSGFGFLGFYIVKPGYRGQGYGLQLWQAAIATLADYTVGLDGVVAQQHNYRASGFQLAHRNIRFKGRGGGPSELRPGIVPLAQVPFQQLQAYDRQHFPGDRPTFLQCWIRQPGHRGFAAWDGTQLQGYGVIRPCRTGFKIGPLFAETGAIAEALFLTLKAQVPDPTPIFLDIPEPNAAGLAIANRYQMTPEFETARMYRGTPPDLPLPCIFGITTFELG
jgi:GNAT superfamily N-acetyltransferase